jgi:hypothetical protein
MCNNFSYLIKISIHNNSFRSVNLSFFSACHTFIKNLQIELKLKLSLRVKCHYKFSEKRNLISRKRGINLNSGPIFWALSYILHVSNSSVFSRTFLKCKHTVEFPIICTEMIKLMGILACIQKGKYKRKVRFIFSFSCNH